MKPYSMEQLADRQAIVDLLYFYCRGVDRHDRDALAKVYWPDAWDDHATVKLAAPEYAEHVIEATRHMRTAHHLTNILVEFDAADGARSESYFLAWHEFVDDSGEEVFIELSGRYLDRFKKRDGEWRILERTLVFDFEQHDLAGKFASPWLARIRRRGAHHPDDLLYRI
ncbi:MAG: nuclear transport factor 2 family protein [Caulobacteraceae bacterium]|nr:nuclear transport factor 2 family protein [Caulobacteraceae bacterium]